MPGRTSRIADEIFEFGTFQITRHNLALCVWRQSAGVAYLAAKLHSGHRDFEIVRVRQHVSVNPDEIERIG
ncbi:MAG TPA: hypothetical protein VGO18_02965, partial [Steroidobacteraceae bacterium]|nr:hypothetical protein [Steroidobacteraceae bacterium]